MAYCTLFNSYIFKMVENPFTYLHCIETPFFLLNIFYWNIIIILHPARNHFIPHVFTIRPWKKGSEKRFCKGACAFFTIFSLSPLVGIFDWLPLNYQKVESFESNFTEVNLVLGDDKIIWDPMLLFKGHLSLW